MYQKELKHENCTLDIIQDYKINNPLNRIICSYLLIKTCISHENFYSDKYNIAEYNKHFLSIFTYISGNIEKTHYDHSMKIHKIFYTASN